MSNKSFNKIINDSKNQQSYSINDFLLQKKIGNGSFGKVYLTKLLKNDQKFASKISFDPISENNKGKITDISREVDIVSKLNHYAILKFIFYSDINFKGRPNPVIITEYAQNGSLEDLLELDRKMQLFDTFNDTQRLIIIYGVASAMSYLHSHKIIHQDLKPSNIFLDKYLFPKIAVSNKIENILTKSIGNENGTTIYMAPEIWSKNEYSEASDVYAFSLIVYEIVTKEKPFSDSNFFQIFDKIRDGLRPEITENIPECYIKLITSCWSQEPKNRPTFSEIVNFLKTDKSFITDSVNENEFLSYIKCIESNDISFCSDKKVFNINNPEIDIDKLISRMNNISEIYPIKEFNQLDERLQKFVLNAEDNAPKQSFIGKSLIEGIYGFPQNTKIGLDYLKHSIKSGYDESVIYYCSMLIKGKIIPHDYKEALQLAKNQFGETSSIYYLMVGKIMKKNNEYEKAKKYLNKSSELEAKYQYYKLLLKGERTEDEINESVLIMKELIKQGFVKAILYYGLKLPQDQFQEKVQCIKIAANKDNPKAMYIYSLLIEKENNELSLEYLKKAANSGHIDSIYKYASALSNNPQNDQKVVNLYKQLADKGHVQSIYKYGLSLLTSATTLEEKRNAARYISISCSYKIPQALVQYAMMNLCGDVIPRNKYNVIDFLQKASEKGDANAYYYLGKLIYNDLIEFDDMMSYTEYFQEAIQLGHKQAMIDMATIIFKDRSISSKSEAIQLCKQAISQGSSEAMVLLAFYFQHGYYVDFDLYYNLYYCGMALENDFSLLNQYFPQTEISQNDRKIVFNLYKTAVSRNNTNAMVHLANLVKDSKDEAAYLLKMAIDRHNMKALTIYAKYLNDQNEDDHKSEIISLLNKGINNNDTTAMRFFAYILEKGKGIAKNQERARKYYQMAIDTGDLDAYNDYALMIFNEIKDKPINKENKSKIELALKMLHNTVDIHEINTLYKEFVNMRGIEIKKCIKTLIESKLEKDSDKDDDSSAYIKSAESLYTELCNSINQKFNQIFNKTNVKKTNFKTTLGFIHDYLITECFTNYINLYADHNKTLKKSEDEALDFIKKYDSLSKLPSIINKNESSKEDKFQSDNLYNSESDTEFINNDEELIKIKKDVQILQQRFNQMNEIVSKTNSPSNKSSPSSKSSPSNKLSPQNKKTLNQAKTISSPKKVIDPRLAAISPRSINNKIKILKKKAEQGDAKAQINLFSCYSLGEGVQQDNAIAFKYCLKAAQSGDMIAQYLVATCYSYGKGIEVDKIKAFEFYLKSAEQGNAKAQFAVGYFYQYGQGNASLDCGKAKEWYKKAASQGHQGAIKVLKKYFHD